MADIDSFDTRRQALLQLLKELSYEERDVTLSSGQKSHFYIDCKQAVLTGAGHILVGACFSELLARAEKNSKFSAVPAAGQLPAHVAVGGLTIGADPLASATALWSTLHGRETARGVRTKRSQRPRHRRLPRRHAQGSSGQPGRRRRGRGDTATPARPPSSVCGATATSSTQCSPLSIARPGAAKLWRLWVWMCTPSSTSPTFPARQRGQGPDEFFGSPTPRPYLAVACRIAGPGLGLPGACATAFPTDGPVQLLRQQRQAGTTKSARPPGGSSPMTSRCDRPT